MTKLKPILRLCEDQCYAYERVIALIEANALSAFESRNGVLIDTTPQHLARFREMLSDLDELLMEHGKPRRIGPKQGSVSQLQSPIDWGAWPKWPRAIVAALLKASLHRR